MIKIPIANNDSIFYAIMCHFVYDKIDKNSSDIISEIKHKYTKHDDAIAEMLKVSSSQINEYRQINKKTFKLIASKLGNKINITMYKLQTYPIRMFTTNDSRHADINIVDDGTHYCYIPNIHEYMKSFITPSKDHEYYCDICRGFINEEKYLKSCKKHGGHGKRTNLFRFEDLQKLEKSTNTENEIVIPKQSTQQPVNMITFSPDQFYQIAKHQIETQNELTKIKKVVFNIHDKLNEPKQIEAPQVKPTHSWMKAIVTIFLAMIIVWIYNLINH